MSGSGAEGESAIESVIWTSKGHVWTMAVTKNKSDKAPQRPISPVTRPLMRLSLPSEGRLSSSF